MSDNPNFRSALNGFNRTDVVHYIEYITSRHNTLVNQLSADNARLQAQLDQARSVSVQDPQMAEELAQALELAKSRQAEIDALKARVEELEDQLSAPASVNTDTEARIRAAEDARVRAEAQVEQLRGSADRELEAYRRAERTERKARERAEQVYHRVNGALADASAQVDDAAVQIGQLADLAIAQLEQLRSAVTGSKDTLRTAAEALITIRPTDDED